MFRSRAERKVAEAGYDPARLPPGQYLTEKWPVLHAGDVPSYPADLAGWDFGVRGEVEHPLALTWDELDALPKVTVTQDIHCVTRWSRFDATFSGVPWSALAEQRHAAPERALRDRALRGRLHRERPALVPRGGGRPPRDPRRRRAAHPGARLAAPARGPGEVLLEERQVAPRDRAPRHGSARLLGALRLPQRRRSLAGAALLVLTKITRKGEREPASGRRSP